MSYDNSIKWRNSNAFSLHWLLGKKSRSSVDTAPARKSSSSSCSSRTVPQPGVAKSRRQWCLRQVPHPARRAPGDDPCPPSRQPGDHGQLQHQAGATGSNSGTIFFTVQ
ncbi:hypothetical protein RRG08_049444 [Elysia crispata]|uniref:Uncharacterized protein n=1 Tax=Elysia crispata TaxID=231223 RepID=A0AAE1DM61_9GAST|nr:hypothetical protein RRG08_049444 [Elysia crispata]